ncbi:hypothetical protein ElyMa_003005000 [Elysia marginata]|uniref:Uncharacterized protein n=1 Tax=Elysia marginata TaxID=1093978 RepID=A0AAV4ICV4_9GAST|nr:hypothetical protein ElyMa_003005000 [Elysia marginata]
MRLSRHSLFQYCLVKVINVDEVRSCASALTAAGNPDSNALPTAPAPSTRYAERHQNCANSPKLGDACTVAGTSGKEESDAKKKSLGLPAIETLLDLLLVFTDRYGGDESPIGGKMLISSAGVELELSWLESVDLWASSVKVLTQRLAQTKGVCGLDAGTIHSMLILYPPLPHPPHPRPLFSYR